VAAIITVGGSLITAGVSTLWGWTQKKKANLLAINIMESAQGLEQQILSRFGFKIDSVHFKSEVLDLEGTYRVIKKTKGVEIIRPGVTLSSLPSRIYNYNPNAKFTKLPSLIGSSQFPKAICLKHTNYSDIECAFQLEITGSLTYGDPGLDYDFELIYSKGQLMTIEELEQFDRQFKKQYVLFQALTPTGNLKLEIIFPKGYLPDTFAGVTLGDGVNQGVIHDLELKRVQNGFSRNDRGATFVIDKPLMGFGYFIYWTPLSKKEVELLKSQ
jgi:hypothetical protein